MIRQLILESHAGAYAVLNHLARNQRTDRAVDVYWNAANHVLQWIAELLPMQHLTAPGPDLQATDQVRARMMRTVVIGLSKCAAARYRAKSSELQASLQDLQNQLESVKVGSTTPSTSEQSTARPDESPSVPPGGPISTK